jgi:16S rRNA processing protein RimM
VCSYGPFLDKSGAVILTPTQGKPGPNGTVTIRLKETLTREQVQAMKGTLLHAPRSALPELDEDEFYYSDLIGLDVENLEGEPLGKVKSVQDFGAGDLLEISGPDGVWFLPFTKDAVPHMDLAGGTLVANPPETIEGDEDKDQ